MYVMTEEIITIKLFGVSKDLITDKEIFISLPQSISVGELKLKILERYPILNSLNDQFVLSINHVIVGDDTLVNANDKISLLPPVSGG